MIRVCRRGGLLPRSACTAHARVATGDDSTDSEAEREVERARILARRKAIEKALREAQGLSSSEDEDEPKRASRSWDQLWYTKVKQPLIQRFRGRRAATQIQAQWRARKARRHLLTLQRIVLREERMKAAFVIQNVWRGHLGRVRMRNHRKACHRAARLIQKGWHRFLFFAAIRRTVRGITLAACANTIHTCVCVCVCVCERVCRCRTDCRAQDCKVVPSAAHQEVPQDAWHHRQSAAVKTTARAGVEGAVGRHATCRRTRTCCSLFPCMNWLHM